MPWTRRAITPLHLPFDEARVTYDPGLVVETRPVDDIGACPVWAVAPLTRLARREVPRLLREAWHVRRLGMADPLAVVLLLRPHAFDGHVMAARPERATVARGDRLLVAMPDLVLPVHGSAQARAFGVLGDVIEGTRPRRLRARPATGPAVDHDALSRLKPPP